MVSLTKHSAVTGINIHELKGVSSAAEDTVVTASSGSSVWQKATVDNMASSAVPFNNLYLHVRYQEATNTAPVIYSEDDGLFYKLYPLNTVVVNNISGSSLASNHVVLPSGTYLTEFDTGNVGQDLNSPGTSAKSKVVVYNSSTDNVLVHGQVNSGRFSCNQTSSGFFTLSSTSNVELRLYANKLTQSDTYLGGYTNFFGNPPLNLGISNVYADLVFWKLS